MCAVISIAYRMSDVWVVCVCGSATRMPSVELTRSARVDCVCRAAAVTMPVPIPMPASTSSAEVGLQTNQMKSHDATFTLIVKMISCFQTVNFLTKKLTAN